MNIVDQVKIHMTNCDWCLIEAEKIIKQFDEAKTQNEKFKLIPKLEHMMSRLSFQHRENLKLMSKKL